MENEKLENASTPQEARKCGVWRVMSWGIGCLGAMALLPALASLVLVMAMATWLSYHTPERLSMPPHWEEGLKLLTNGGTGVQTIASERFNTAQMDFDGEAFIIRLNSDEDCKRFVEQILRRNPNARNEAPPAPPAGGKLYSRFVAQNGGGGDRYVFDLFGGCPYGMPQKDAMYVQAGAERTWYVRYTSGSYAEFAAGATVASVRRSYALKDGSTCRVQIDVERLPGNCFQARIQDISPAESRGRLCCDSSSLRLTTSGFSSLFDAQEWKPLRTDTHGMGLYQVTASAEDCVLYYAISSTDSCSEDDRIIGKIPLTPTRYAPMEAARPGCWGHSEFPTAPLQPASALPLPDEADRVSHMLIEIPLPDGVFGKMRVDIYRQENGFLFITEDVTPDAPFYISDISIGVSRLAGGQMRCLIGPSYNKLFTPLQTSRQGIGRFFLAMDEVMALHPHSVSVSFEFLVCDAEGRSLTSFSAEVDMPPSSATETAMLLSEAIPWAIPEKQSPPIFSLPHLGGVCGGEAETR